MTLKQFWKIWKEGFILSQMNRKKILIFCCLFIMIGLDIYIKKYLVAALLPLIFLFVYSIGVYDEYKEENQNEKNNN